MSTCKFDWYFLGKIEFDSSSRLIVKWLIWQFDYDMYTYTNAEVMYTWSDADVMYMCSNADSVTCKECKEADNMKQTGYLMLLNRTSSIAFISSRNLSWIVIKLWKNKHTFMIKYNYLSAYFLWNCEWGGFHFHIRTTFSWKQNDFAAESKKKTTAVLYRNNICNAFLCVSFVVIFYSDGAIFLNSG